MLEITEDELLYCFKRMVTITEKIIISSNYSLLSISSRDPSNELLAQQ